MIFHRLIAVGIVFAFFLFLPFSVCAVISISIQNAPTTLEQSEEKSIDILFSCPGCSSDSYLRGVFYPSGTKYFGYTKNNDGSWINASGSNCTQYFKLTSSDFSEGSWSGQLKVKIDTASEYYSGPGEYAFKIGRYTSSCGSTWSDEKVISVSGPSVTPSPSPTSSPTITPTNAPTPTRTPTPTVTPKKTPTVTVKSTPTELFRPSISVDANVNADTGEVLGEEHLIASSSSSSNSLSRPIFVTSLLLVSVGSAMMALVLLYKKKYKV